MRIKLFCYLSIISIVTSCSLKRAKIDNSLKTYFDANQVEGSFTMLNNSTGGITIYNIGMDTLRVSPGGTFNIVSSLIGLEIGKIINENMPVKWDGVSRNVPEWNRDLTMKEAFKINALPYYQAIVRSIGTDTLKKWIDSLGYGNKNIKAPIDSFWINNTLKISPDEQLGMVKRLYFDQLPFRKSTQEIVRNAMLQQNNTAYSLSYQTGQGIDEQNNTLGWLVGWIEENRHVYFFVTLIKAKSTSINAAVAPIDITKNILKKYGFFEGKK